MTVTAERVVHIDCAGQRLLGILHPAWSGAASRRAVLFLVGGPQYRVGSHRQFLQAARQFASEGHPVLRFDFRGMGDSGGESPGFERVGEDCRAALDMLFREAPNISSVCVVGLCDAASAALLHCVDDSRVDALVLANPWVRTDVGEAATYVRHYYGPRLLQGAFWRKLLRGGVNPFAAASGFLGSLRASRQRSASHQMHFTHRMLDGLERFKGSVLLLMSGRDLTAREFDRLCQADARWSRALSGARLRRVDVPEADHTFSSRASLNAANAMISRFLQDPGG
jgi:exosortase A-associated hydrolase 1